jgi:hypothetical protein
MPIVEKPSDAPLFGGRAIVTPGRPAGRSRPTDRPAGNDGPPPAHESDTDAVRRTYALPNSSRILLKRGKTSLVSSHAKAVSPMTS